MDNANVTSTLNANDKNRIVASNKYTLRTVWLMVNLIELTWSLNFRAWDSNDNLMIMRHKPTWI